MKLKDKIKKFMEYNQIQTLAEFARQVGLPYTTVENIFKRSGSMTSTTLLKLKTFMSVSADELLDDNINIDFEIIKNDRYINGDIATPDNTVISIGRGGKRSIYSITDQDAALVDDLLERLGKKKE